MGTLAVVPIFMSAGAAVMPAVVAAVTSVVAIAVRPRELLRLCRRRPAAVGASLGVIALGVVAASWWRTSDTRAATSGRGETRAGHYDWARVAEDIIAREGAAGALTARAVAGSPTAVAVQATGVSQGGGGSSVGAVSLSSHGSAGIPLILGRDASRCSYGTGPSPVRLSTFWRYVPEETMFLSAPLVVGNRVFTAGCQSDLGGYTGLLACLDAETGKPIWEVTRKGDDVLRPFFSSPALTQDGRYLVIGQGLHADRECSLLCFEAVTGKLHWEVKTALHIESSPAIHGDMAVVGAGAIEGRDGQPTGDPGFVLAVRISDGRELWRQVVNDPESAPAIDENGAVYIGSGFNGSAVVALRSEPEEQLRAGKFDRILWRTAVAHPVVSAIALAGDLVIAGGGNSDAVHSNRNAEGMVVALDRKTGRIRWQTLFEDSVLGGSACREDRLVCPVRTGEVAALSLQDGRVLWRTAISRQAPVIAACAFTGQRVYAVSSDGYLAVVDSQDGQVLERVYLNDQARPGTGLAMCSPQVSGGRVIAGSETGGLHCLVGSEGNE
ncbi:MAG: PQQ-binding-like beta-propeller repeat protein [Phycisphaerae bacterium]|nr:PQQ-binding-like beta-propeller repeat protein [Phycisphaerae bacterium]